MCKHGTHRTAVHTCVPHKARPSPALDSTGTLRVLAWCLHVVPCSNGSDRWTTGCKGQLSNDAQMKGVCIYPRNSNGGARTLKICICVRLEFINATNSCLSCPEVRRWASRGFLVQLYQTPVEEKLAPILEQQWLWKGYAVLLHSLFYGPILFKHPSRH